MNNEELYKKICDENDGWITKLFLRLFKFLGF